MTQESTRQIASTEPEDSDDQEEAQTIASVFQPDFTLYLVGASDRPNDASLQNEKVDEGWPNGAAKDSFLQMQVEATFQFFTASEVPSPGQETSQGPSASQQEQPRIMNQRRDLIWKPLTRMFRRWLKGDTLPAKHYRQIRTFAPAQQCELFADALKISEHVAASKRDKVALLLLVNSHRITWRRRLFPEVETLLKPYHAQLWPIYMDFFQYTSHSKRMKFFKEPLVKDLWPKFIAAKPLEIENFLAQVQRDHQHHPRVYTQWLEEVSQTELMTGCKILKRR